MTQLDNIRSSRPIVKFPTRCGSANLQRVPKYSANNQEIPNTFLSALDWIARHDAMLRKFVNLVQQFPNLINDPEMLYFNLFLTQHYQTRVNDEQEKAVERILHSPHARRAPSSYSLLSPAKIDVYISGEICETQWTNTDFIARELAQHFKVQTDPPLPRYPGFQTEEDLVMSCNVMLFVLSDKSLSDPFCIHQLRTAISHHVPVVLVREPEGTDIPASLAAQDIPISLSRPVTALADIADKSPVLFLDDSTKPPGRDQNRGVNRSVDKINSFKETAPQKRIMLVEWLKDEMSAAQLFTFEHRATCIGKIVGRIKNVALGEVLVDGFGNNLPTELPSSPDNLGNVGPCFQDSKVADMAESLLASPTSSLWGGVPNCGKCGQHLPLPDRLSAISTPMPSDPTLSKFLHYSQKNLHGKTRQAERPSTAPSSLGARGSPRKKEEEEAEKRVEQQVIEETVEEAIIKKCENRAPGGRPTSARSVTFSDTDQVVPRSCVD